MTGTDDAIRTKRISNMLQSPMPGGWVQPPGIVLLAQQAFPPPAFQDEKNEREMKEMKRQGVEFSGADDIMALYCR